MRRARIGREVRASLGRLHAEDALVPSRGRRDVDEIGEVLLDDLKLCYEMSVELIGSAARGTARVERRGHRCDLV